MNGRTVTICQAASPAPGASAAPAAARASNRACSGAGAASSSNSAAKNARAGTRSFRLSSNAAFAASLWSARTSRSTRSARSTRPATSPSARRRSPWPRPERLDEELVRAAPAGRALAGRLAVADVLRIEEPLREDLDEPCDRVRVREPGARAAEAAALRVEGEPGQAGEPGVRGGRRREQRTGDGQPQLRREPARARREEHVDRLRLDGDDLAEPQRGVLHQHSVLETRSWSRLLSAGTRSRTGGVRARGRAQAVRGTKGVAGVPAVSLTAAWRADRLRRPCSRIPPRAPRRSSPPGPRRPGTSARPVPAHGQVGRCLDFRAELA